MFSKNLSNALIDTLVYDLNSIEEDLNVLDKKTNCDTSKIREHLEQMQDEKLLILNGDEPKVTYKEGRWQRL